MSKGNFPESLSQRILAGIILVAGKSAAVACPTPSGTAVAREVSRAGRHGQPEPHPRGD